jgi:hypothetical protein
VRAAYSATRDFKNVAEADVHDVNEEKANTAAGVAAMKDKEKAGAGASYIVRSLDVGVMAVPRDGAELVRAVKDVIDGLKELHGLKVRGAPDGFVHRDVRWPNVVFYPRSGVWKIIDLDFGSRLTAGRAAWPADLQSKYLPDELYDVDEEERYWCPAFDFAMAAKNLVGAWVSNHPVSFKYLGVRAVKS